MPQAMVLREPATYDYSAAKLASIETMWQEVSMVFVDCFAPVWCD
jgi:hypothetical protein